MSVSVNYIFVGRKLLEPHRTAGMKLLGRNSHFATETKFSAVGKAGRGVDVNSGAVHSFNKVICGRIISGDDSFAVPC